MKTYFVVGFSAIFLAAALSACGGGGGKSFNNEKKKFEKPTGKVQSDNVKSIADAFKETLDDKNNFSTGGLSSGLSSVGLAQEPECNYPIAYTGGTVDITCSCSNGGNFVYEIDPSSASETSVDVEYSFNGCDWGYGCTVDGSGWMLYSGTREANASWIFTFEGCWTCSETPKECGTYEIFYECLNSVCDYWYLVNLSDGTYVGVKGWYDGTNGEFTIKAANGIWECTATNGSGSCTDGTHTHNW